jgi:nitrogen fixation protein FixH
MSNFSGLGFSGWFAVIAVVAFFALGLSLLFMVAWNAGPAAVFGLPTINEWWRSLCILVCAGLLLPPRVVKK